MSVPGYVEYKRREFCNDVACPVQVKLNSQEEGSPEYERTREVCKKNCRFSARDFHYWLTDKGYVILRHESKIK